MCLEQSHVGDDVSPVAEDMAEDTEDTEGKAEYIVDHAAWMLAAAL